MCVAPHHRADLPWIYCRPPHAPASRLLRTVVHRAQAPPLTRAFPNIPQGVFDMQYGMKIDVVKGASVNPGGADGSKSMATPRPDGPQPTEQQINEGPYTGRHAGGWKMKRGLLEPAENKEWGRHTSMSNVTGVFFTEPKERWYETHNSAVDVRPAEDFKMRLYPLDRDMYSPWEATTWDKTPASKTIGSFYETDKKGALTGVKTGGYKAEVAPHKEVAGSSFATAHIQGHARPASKGIPPKGEIKKLVKTATLSDNPSWGKVREGDESNAKPDPAWGYTGHPYAKRCVTPPSRHHRHVRGWLRAPHEAECATRDHMRPLHLRCTRVNASEHPPVGPKSACHPLAAAWRPPRTTPITFGLPARPADSLGSLPAPTYSYDKGEEDLSMASRISRRRQQSIERRFSASPYAAHIAQDVLKLGDGIEPPDIGPYGCACHAASTSCMSTHAHTHAHTRTRTCTRTCSRMRTRTRMRMYSTI